MSKDIDLIMRELAKSSKEIHNIDNHMSKDLSELKRTIRSLENRIVAIEGKINQMVSLLNTFTILMTETDEDEDEDQDYEDTENSQWNPYDNPEEYSDDEDNDGEIYEEDDE